MDSAMHITHSRQITLPEGLTPEEQQEIIRMHQVSVKLRHELMGVWLAGASGSLVLPPGAPPALEGFSLYTKEVQKDAGGPKDPIEQMLIEQITLAHHNIGRLGMRAAAAQTLEEVEVFEAAHARLLSEFRRAIGALKDYREPSGQRQLTFVKQQNLAQHQQVALVEGERAVRKAESAEMDASEENRDTELTRNDTEVIEHVESINSLTESAARGSGQAEPIEAKGADASGAT